MPIRDLMPSDAFEVALQLPIGHDLVEACPLLLRGVEEVEVNVVAERLLSDLGFLELVHRLYEVPWDTFDILGLVRVADVHVRRLEPVLDAVQSRDGGRCEGQVRVPIRTGDPRLDAEALAVANNAIAAGPVVD